MTTTVAPYTTQLQAGLGMVEETMTLLNLWHEGIDVPEICRLALSSGQFPNLSARRLRNIVAECFAPRLLADEARPAKTMKLLSPHLDPRSIRQLLFVFTCRANQILSDFVRDLTQEELLNQPVHIPHRPLKDPREIRMLDPACGSMHFGLYAFDVYLTIYEEFWDLVTSDPSVAIEPTDLTSLTQAYESRDAFLRDVPRLIIHHNIHGIDIDPRAVQIAGLSLWLRAQRAWQSQGLAAGDRPQVTRSNVVCAEPMPGDKQQLEAFCKELHPAIAQMVTAIFEAMKLAGEAGSLLKIEQEIKSLVAAAKKQFQDNPPDKKTQMQLFGDTRAVKEQQLAFDLSGITDEQFFEKAEEEIYEALRRYASEASDGGFRRKLFANDAERGFAFLDVSRTAFDVALMNPPFGDASNKSKPYLKTNYGQSYHDIAACFTKRATGPKTIVGAITSRSLLMLTTFEEWRRHIFFENTKLSLAVDLGGGVLDGALVETALFVVSNTTWPNSFLDLTGDEEKSAGLLNSLANMEDCPNAFIRDIEEFSSIPGMPICFTAPSAYVDLFAEHKAFEENFGTVKQGLITSDDFRFVRAWWETDEAQKRVSWFPFSKGGEFAKYFDDIHLEVNWKNAGAELWAYYEKNRARSGGIIKNPSYYFRPGLTYPFRSQKGFSVRPLPAGSIFSLQGSAIFPDGNLREALAFFNSRLAESLLKMISSFGAWQVGYVGSLPFIPNMDEEVVDLVDEVIREKQRDFASNETSLLFVSPFERNGNKKKILEFESRIDSLVESHYLKTQIDSSEPSESISEDFQESSGDSAEDTTSKVLSYAIGCVLGRWSTKLGNLSGSIDPFAPLPIRSQIMIDNKNLDVCELTEACKLDAGDARTSGIIELQQLVTSVDSLVDRVFSKMEEPCYVQVNPIDTVKRLTRPNEFFAEHLKSYSKSRREAPIYWPISTESGSYRLWFYYHRLTDQTLYKAVNDFVDPKLKETGRHLADLRAIQDRSSAQEKELAKLTELESELEQFKADLLEIATFWKPNLNDGVQITAAPLWKFFRLTKWRNKLKKTWEELQAGKYDWAHLALSIWPDRVVREKCTTDRSIAIAHDVEDQLWHEVEIQKTSKSGKVSTKMEWQPRDLSDAELDAIVTSVVSGRAVEVGL